MIDFNSIEQLEGSTYKGYVLDPEKATQVLLSLVVLTLVTFRN